MSHIVVAIFIGIAAAAAVADAPPAAHVADRDPGRRGRRRVDRGVAAAAAVAAGVHAEHAVHEAPPRGTSSCRRGSRSRARCGTRIKGFWNAFGRPPLDPNTNPVKHFSPTLWLPWWMWLLAGVAIVAAGWYRRRSTLVLLVLALVIGVMFIEWPEHAIWNTRFLPFWMLTWAFLAAMGATEIVRLVGLAASSAYRWIRDGDLQDARARAWASIATADDDDDRSTRGAQGRGVGARRAPVRSRARRLGAAGASSPSRGGRHGPPHRRDRARGRRRGRRHLRAASREHATNNNPAIAIRGWAAWNYSGYERRRRTRSTTRS